MVDPEGRGLPLAMRHVGRQSGIFSPASIPGMVALYDWSDISSLWQDTGRTSAITANGQTIKGVTDKSGSGNHLSEATNGPTWESAGQNGRGTAKFDGVNDQLRCAGFTQAQPLTIFYAVQLVAFAGATQITDLNDGITSGTIMFAGANANPTWFYGAGSNVPSAVARDLNFNIHTAVFHGATSTLRHNGSVGASGNPSTNPYTSLSLGSDSFGNFWNMRYGELAIYSGHLVSAQLQSLESYGKAKWGTP